MEPLADVYPDPEPVHFQHLRVAASSCARLGWAPWPSPPYIAILLAHPDQRSLWGNPGDGPGGLAPKTLPSGPHNGSHPRSAYGRHETLASRRSYKVGHDGIRLVGLLR